jgi:hypothetical protein
VRTGGGVEPALQKSLAFGTLLSLAMELLQNFLPNRVASNVDLGTNALGTLAGAGIGAWVHRHGLVDRWQAARDRWFIRQSAGGIALLLLWPVGMLFPLPVPLAQGQVLPKLQEGLSEWLADTMVGPWFEGWADSGGPHGALAPAGEFALIALGLLAPCLVAFSVARAGWRRLSLVLFAVALGWLTTSLSTASVPITCSHGTHRRRWPHSASPPHSRRC